MMSKFLRYMLSVSLAILGNRLLLTNVAQAAESDKIADLPKSIASLEQKNELIEDAGFVSQSFPIYHSNFWSERQEAVVLLIADQSEKSQTLAQVNSVSQLSDVQPIDWAFGALQSLTERYGCIAGYPNGTYRGNRAMTRLEFAAGLNACLDRINELIATATTDFVSKEDLATLQKLQEDFASELATLWARVDAVEAKTAEIEAKQFSTTTKLNGEIITYIADGFGRDASSVNNTILNYRVRLNFDTSFTGSDRLRLRLQAANLNLLNAGNPNIDNSTSGFGAPQRFASTYPGIFSDEARILPSPASQSENDNSFRIHVLSYDFPLSDKLNAYVAAGVTDPTFLGADPITPFSDYATGSISNFANSNPIYYPMGQRGGAGLSYKIIDFLTISGGYMGQDVNGIGGVSVPDPTSGLFNGGYTAFGQLTYYSSNLKVGLVYLNTYTPQFGIDTLTGSNAAKVSTGFVTEDDEVVIDDRVSANHYGLIANYRMSERFELGGWVGYSNARVLGVNTIGESTGNNGDVKVLNYALTFAFPDLWVNGNLGGIVFAMQPKVIDSSNARVAQAIGLSDERRTDRDTGFHIEAFYRFQLNKNISITPGFLWLTAPNHDERNADAVIGIVRTSFVF